VLLKKGGNLLQEERAFMFDLGLLHDIGVSSTRVHRNLVTEFDWPEAWRHCRAGHDLLEDFPPLAAMAGPILHHHTSWTQLQEQSVNADMARRSNLILLTDRVDAMAAPFHADKTLLAHAEAIRNVIRGHAGTYFSPELTELFLEASRTEAFWLHQEPRAIDLYLRDQLSQTRIVPLDNEELRKLALIFARIVDAKSPFTAKHSQGVARLARLLGELSGLDEDTCIKLEVAGLLHDLGKLRVADEILDKPDRLSSDERFVINTHTFETHQILSRIPGFEDITRWASHHHEEPDGSGYPCHISESRLSLQDRIMRVADIFQAMIQDRPYRRGLGPERVREFMRDMADAGRIDRTVADLLDANFDKALLAASPADDA
jgi:HD-GYP domain-containing protein (c-di-GMP phosphodiesterase class II)